MVFLYYDTGILYKCEIQVLSQNDIYLKEKLDMKSSHERLIIHVTLRLSAFHIS